jgi:hypothetical protein
MASMLKIHLLVVCFVLSEGWYILPRRDSKKLYTCCKASNNNIVLRPSENPVAFDSFKVGSPRVHRYVSDEKSGQSAQYVMWYHGRPTSWKDDSSLPPLSSGRIGSAVSLNGLLWEKVTDGSLAEDVSDVSLGINQDSWWAFDTKHVGLGQVLLPMSTPSVISEGGVYLMYYFGGTEDASPIVNYLDTKSDSIVKGMKMRIGVAVSQDGKTWGRVEGEDPTGACVVPHDANDPNQKGLSFVRDEDDSLIEIDEELYCAWPEVTLRLRSEDVEESVKGKTPPMFFMYYSMMRKKDKAKCIALAVSSDGFVWKKRGVCVEPETLGFDDAGCARCNVFPREKFENGKWTIESGWHMLYEGVSKIDGKHRILSAESEDGRVWKKKGIALDIGESTDSWDNNGVGSPHVIRLDDGSIRMYYTGQGTGGSTAIGVARTYDVEGLQNWRREQAEVPLLR